MCRVLRRDEYGKGDYSTLAVAAYEQKKMDSLLGVDGRDEFTIYLAPVDKIE
jgi:hypothetical protein